MHDPFEFTEPTPPGPASYGAPPLPYLDGLNEAQRAAVEATDGPVLVLAGAGTGKTRVLTTRLAHILFTRRDVRPYNLLAVTFTNKAAREMRERVAALIGPAAEQLWLGTFHALCTRILRSHAELVGLKSNFTILDTDDQIRLLKQVIQAEGIDEKRWPARAALAVIQRWKDKGLTPEAVPSSEVGEFAGGRILELYRLYQARLSTLNAADFGDLLLHCLTLFTQNEDVLRGYQQRFRYILVDEYQDTNVAQYLWLRLLARAHRNICCVGDDDQCVAAGTLVTLGDGSTKPVETVRPGETVMSSYGSGDFRPAVVTEAFRQRVHRPLVRLRTASGRELLTTPEHNHFADVILHESPQKYFTYLMHKRGYGYRLGTSQVYTKGQRRPVIGYQQRCVQEHADAVWLVRAFESENDAREFEHRLSLKYGITTLPFVARKGGSANGLVHDQERLDRLHRDISDEARIVELMEDFGLDPALPHHVPQSEPGRRRNLTLTLNAEHRGMTPMHRIALSGNDDEGALALADLGLKARTYRRNPKNWRYETLFRDLGKLENIKARLATRFDLTVVRKANILGKALVVRPAVQIVPGMVVPLADGRHDVVVSVEQVDYHGNVYDLNVAGTHNFVANGIVTHNSIYSWRGAEVGNILRFETDFPGARVIRLERNYRSTPHILAAASGLIAHNQGRLGKTLWTDADSGEKVVVRGVWDGEEEARWVCDEIEALQRKGHGLDQIAILVRAGFQMREFEERLITTGIPYRVVGGPRFYERQEIRDALAYFRVTVQPDDGLAFERILNVPKRGLADASLQLLHRVARAQDVSLMEAARALITTDELKPKPRKSLSDLIESFDRWRAMLDGLPHAEVAATILDESGYTEMWQHDTSPEAPGRLENLRELIGGLEEYPSLPGFLEHVSLVMDNDAAPDSDKITLMTLHAAKGLEFDTVFLPGWEEGLFPHQRALDESGLQGLEEERRLAYVGLTRARKRAVVCFAANRRMYNQWQTALPSRFIAELPAEHVERHSETGVYGSAWGGYGAGGHGERGARELPFDYASAGFRSGGWPQRRGGTPTIEGEARTLDSGGSAASGFKRGERVLHDKFGPGTIALVEGNKLEIDFDKAGRKKVVDSFVKRL